MLLRKFADVIFEDINCDAKVRCEAQSLYKKMCLLKTGLMVSFWTEILENLTKTNNGLQNSKMQLNTATVYVTLNH